jgi:predicted nuclease with RNAse H fold
MVVDGLAAPVLPLTDPNFAEYSQGFAEIARTLKVQGRSFHHVWPTSSPGLCAYAARTVH